VIHAIQKKYTIKKLTDYKRKGRLKLQPWFQRNAIWPEKARYGLIDTVYRGLPVPEVFIWKHDDKYHVVDGQQRLRAVIDFVNGKGQDKKNPQYAIKQLQNSSIIIDDNLKNKTYQDLASEGMENQIDNYQFDVREITGGNNSQIEDLFHRLNTNVFENNPQELRNAITHGDLKSLANELTKEFRNFLLNNKIRTLNQVARQQDTETVINEILLLAVNGEISGSDKKIKDELYKNNKTMGNKNQIRNNIIKTQNIITRIFPEQDFVSTMFTKHTNYLALFSALYMAITGGWSSKFEEKLKFGYPDTDTKRRRLKRSLEDFSRDVTNGIEKGTIRGGANVKDYVNAFVERHTTERRIRMRKARCLIKVMEPNLMFIDASPGPTAKIRKELYTNWKKRSKDNKPICVKCNKKISSIAKMDVGHNKFKGKGGKNSIKNYQPEHVSCNRRDNQI